MWQLQLNAARSGISQAAGSRTVAAAPLPAAPPPVNPPPLEKFHADNIRSLTGICRRVLDGAQTLVSYVDGNRETAKLAGIEALAAEISGIMEGGRLQDLQDHLDHALARNNGTDLTIENLSRLNRTERLLSEANRALAFFAGPSSMRMQATGLAVVPPATSAPTKDSTDTLLIVAIIGLSAVGIAASIVAALAIFNDSQAADRRNSEPW